MVVLCCSVVSDTNNEVKLFFVADYLNLGNSLIFEGGEGPIFFSQAINLKIGKHLRVFLYRSGEGVGGLKLLQTFQKFQHIGKRQIPYKVQFHNVPNPLLLL